MLVIGTLVLMLLTNFIIFSKMDFGAKMVYYAIMGTIVALKVLFYII